MRLSALQLGIAAALVCGSFSSSPVEACTRVVYLGADGNVVTARSMDWTADMGTNLWILPRGVARTGQAGPTSIQWTSKYGSVIASGYDISSTDGMNEAGLSTQLLWLAESKYPQPGKDKPVLALSLWAQYVLDNYATVAEAVAALEQQPFTPVTAKMPGQDRLATLHLSMSDASGDSAIVEYIDGKQVIHHGRQYQVMTNSPTFDQQLALNAYWEQVGGTVMLPGTTRPADRFVRASFYIKAIPQDATDPVDVLASVFSVIRNASVPYGISTPGAPNIASTRWRTVADHKRMLYFFESAETPNTFWVDLKQVDFSTTGGTRKLDLGQDQRNVYAGDTSGKFVSSAPFKFIGL